MEEIKRKVNKTEEEWKKILTPEQFEITRKKGTEKPFTGEYCNFKENGIYACVCCGEKLFDSDKKYDSGSGWPSFFDVISKENLEVIKDLKHGMVREEVVCKKCGCHLGHVFPDGPMPTGLRYCTNSASIKFIKKDRKE